MKRTLLFLFLLPALQSSAQTVPYEICSGSTPQLEGLRSPGEWDDASSVGINAPSGAVTVSYKHNGDSLFFLFEGPLESANARFPEVLIDAGNDKAVNWDANDWWFHVSATDCSFNGQYGNYSGNCFADHSSWSGVPNMVNGPPHTDTIEISIPFSTLGIASGDTIGLTFDVTNTATAWSHWPAAAGRNNPSTWATAMISACTIGIAEKQQASTWRCFPQPFRETCRLENPQGKSANISLLSADGRTLLRRTVAAGDASLELDLRSLPAGFYFLEIAEADRLQMLRLVKQ